MFNVAYAMGQGAGGEGGGGLAAFVPLILMFVIFYFLLIRPQSKKQKLHKELLSNLKKGDQVVTTGGLYGQITGITETMITLEIAERVRVKVARGFIQSVVSPSNQPSVPEPPAAG